MVLLVAALVAIDLGFGISFSQQRPGLFGRPFKLHKFCTMAGAHDAKGRRLSDEERMSGIGRFLRRTRLDELLQLHNILVGHMSFVGPRPLLPVDQPAAYAARLLVRPGLTGWAQVKGGRTISAADKAALDVWYVRNASLKLDLKIMAHTAPIVLFGERVSREAIRSAWRELREAGICASGELAGEGKSR
jgi:lipopolysaccharide/colanic/teichoic acid biosynthesis glycosyltransferase